MTQTALARLMLLAAGAGITALEFREFIDGIYASNPTEILHAYNELRRKIRYIQVSELQQTGLDFDTRGPTRTVRSDIVRLMKKENIKTSDAADRIRGKLLDIPNIGASIPEFKPREGFSRWLERVAKIVGPSTLLNTAISILTSNSPDNLQNWHLSHR